MALYKRGRYWHYKFEVGGVRYRGSTRCTERREAEAALKRLRRELPVAGAGEAPGPLTLGEAAASWWDMKGSGLRSAVTVAQRLEIARRCLSFDLAVEAVGAREIAEAMAKRRRQKVRRGRQKTTRLPTPSTVNRDIIDTIRPVLNHARTVLGARVQEIDWKALRLREPRGRVREFSDAELAAVFEAMPPHYREIAAFLARYGTRLREAWFALSDFDAETGRIRLRNRKGGGEHVIRVIDADRRALAARAGRAAAAGLDTVWFREGRRGPEPIRPAAYQAAAREAFLSVGITNARPAHDFRHHAATRLVKETGNLRLAQALLGHENIATTARYAHAAEDDVAAAIEASVARSGHSERPQFAQGSEKRGKRGVT